MSKGVVVATDFPGLGKVKLCPHCSVEKDKMGKEYPIIQRFCPVCDNAVFMRACPHTHITRQDLGPYRCDRCGVMDDGTAAEHLDRAWVEANS